jgi:hypothetical protein
LHGDVVRVHLCLHCITVNNNNNNNNNKIDFLSEIFFPYFFRVHLNILDMVVSSQYAIFGTPVLFKYTKSVIHPLYNLYLRNMFVFNRMLVYVIMNTNNSVVSLKIIMFCLTSKKD